mgnify:FL=1
MTVSLANISKLFLQVADGHVDLREIHCQSDLFGSQEKVWQVLGPLPPKLSDLAHRVIRAVLEHIQCVLVVAE